MDLLDVLAADERPIGQATRDALLEAVKAAAAEHGGVVSIATIRPHLPGWCKAQILGTYVSALVRRGVLVWTGGFTTNGNAEQRNALRPAKTYRYVPEAVTA